MAPEAGSGTTTTTTTTTTTARSGPPSPSPSPAAETMAAAKSKKRPAPAADLDAPPKVAKRRAARACVSCRARKVRCDVVESSPCGNCRWDNVECIVQESRRRKKHHQLQLQLQHQPPVLATANTAASSGRPAVETQLPRCRATSTANPPVSIASAAAAPRSDCRSSVASTAGSGGTGRADGHVPHMIYQRTAGHARLSHVPWNPSLANHADLLLFGDGQTSHFPGSMEAAPPAAAKLPAFLRPLPSKIAPEDVLYLDTKGALKLPGIRLQSALLQAYAEFVHPYMPLMDLHDFIDTVARRDELHGQISLLLYQAAMFSATAFVDVKFLREAGYASRKAARKAFFQKTRLLYDFDYESDRLVLVQALMLMTYWYETPDDQKDTWHWMGVAISLAHTIGLHRNPEATSMSVSKQRLWKRIWWSCFMRDRLIALGMRRPTRIKDEDFDVPMLVEADFEIRALPDGNSVMPPECTLLRDVGMQRELAVMCIAKAKLCLCISRMLKAQYSVLIRDKMRPDNTTNSTMMLFPNKKLDNMASVNAVDLELDTWANMLPACCRYRPLGPSDVEAGRSTVAVQRTLLHMVYHTTISALHRPQFLPSSPMQAPTASRQAQEMSRLRVRDAAAHITRMATELHHLRLERFLPTTGVTVILPAMIIHLLEMKNPAPQARERATRGFRQCMRVMEKLREIYAAADYATGFLDAALKKAAIDVNVVVGLPIVPSMKPVPVELSAQTPPPENILLDATLAGTERLGPKPRDGGEEEDVAGQEPILGEGECSPMAMAQIMLPPNTVNGAALDMSANSPPHTDMGSAGLTPSASCGASDAGLQQEIDAVDLDFMQGHDEFDWNAVAGTDFDVDQWLQFPPEGVSGVDDEADKEPVDVERGSDEVGETSVKERDPEPSPVAGGPDEVDDNDDEDDDDDDNSDDDDDNDDDKREEDELEDKNQKKEEEQEEQETTNVLGPTEAPTVTPAVVAASA